MSITTDLVNTQVDALLNEYFGNYLKSWTIAFKSSGNYNCVNTPFTGSNKDGSFSKVGFVGYTFEYIGEDLDTSDIQNSINSSMNTVNSNITNMQKSIEGKLGNLESSIDDLKESTEKQLEVQEQVKENTSGILNTVKSVLTGITNLPGNIWNSIKGGFDAITNALSSLGDTIGGFFSALGDKIGGFFENLMKSFKEDTENQTGEINGKLDEEFKTCRPSNNLFDINSVSYRSSYTGINSILSINDSNSFILENTVLDDWNGIFVNNLDPNKTYTISSSVKLLNYNSISAFVVYKANDLSQYLRTNLVLNETKTVTYTFNGSSTVYILIPPRSTISFDEVMLNDGSTSFSFEPYGEDVCTNKMDETNDKLGDLNNTMNSSDTSGAEGQANGFFGNFKDDDYGLSDVITMPLSFINNISKATCSPLEIPLPFVSQNINLPCMMTVYQTYFGGFLTIYQTITTGMIAYWICINLFATVKGFKDPDSDNVEVMEL